MAQPTRILIVGGGFIGLYAALGLQKRLRPEEADVTLVSPESFMLYQPFLPEVASGTIEPRHAVVPLRDVLTRTRLITGMVTGIDHDRRTAMVQPAEGEHYDVAYEQIVLGVGSDPRVLPIPGLHEEGLGFSTIGEAAYLRNRVLSRLDLAESTTDARKRARALTFVFVGGGYSGVEALAELEDLARDATRKYPSVSREDMRWILVEARDAILPEVGDRLGRYALDRLRERSIEVRLGTMLESAAGGRIELSDGTVVEADTLVWTAGVRADALASRTGWPTGVQDRVEVDEFLRVRGTEGAWAAGDAAAVPKLDGSGIHPPTAQHAVRQGRLLARNLAAALRHEELEAFRYSSLGLLVSLGRYRGVAEVMGRRLRGFPAWLLHRSYHLLMIPTLRRKARVVADWTVSLFFERDIVQLDSLREPRRSFAGAFDRGKDG